MYGVKDFIPPGFTAKAAVNPFKVQGSTFNVDELLRTSSFGSLKRLTLNLEL